MVIDMNESKLRTLEQLRAFLQGTLEVEFFPAMGQDKAQRYAHIQALGGIRDFVCEAGERLVHGAVRGSL